MYDPPTFTVLRYSMTFQWFAFLYILDRNCSLGREYDAYQATNHHLVLQSNMNNHPGNHICTAQHSKALGLNYNNKKRGGRSLIGISPDHDDQCWHGRPKCIIKMQFRRPSYNSADRVSQADQSITYHSTTRQTNCPIYIVSPYHFVSALHCVSALDKGSVTTLNDIVP